MDLTESNKLLRDYADYGNEAAFRELVDRYIDLVYSAALRRVGGNADTAQDVTQAVFTDLARKARSLGDVEMLGGWLHRHTGFVAANFVRSEQRRQIREQEAAQMNVLQNSPDALWQQLSPVLDETIDSLEPADRQAILLRFFERHDFRSIGSRLGVSEDAAQKRVSRALEKLRELLARRDVTLSVVLLGTLMAGKVVKAAPTGLAAKVAGLALAGAMTGAGLAVTMAKIANSLGFKIALAAIVVGTATKLILSSRSPSTVETARQGNAGVPPVKTQTAGTPAADAQVPAAALTALSSSLTTASNNLMLTVVSADSGQPIPSAGLDYWTWIQGKLKHQKPLQTTPAGTCEVTVPDGTTELILVSQVDGFADTRLEWHPDQGETIPTTYTLRLPEAVPIGGRVVDPNGNPVANAQVGFNNGVGAALETFPQSDNFSWPFWIPTTTDTQGRWQINRIGKEALQSIYGGATHPDYVNSASVSASSDTNGLEQLLASTYVFSLERAVTLRGTVQDEQGQSISNAAITIGEAGAAQKTTSQIDGTFSFTGCRPGTNTITAQAAGFAPTVIETNISDNSPPVQFVLRPGILLKLRVVDAAGNPIPQATVFLEDARPPGVQASFSGHTDADGRLEWDSAPDQELNFDALADGYMRSPGTRIRPDGTEHEIILQPALTISGTVRDATMGQPVPAFRIVTGWPNRNLADNSTRAC